MMSVGGGVIVADKTMDIIGEQSEIASKEGGDKMDNRQKMAGEVGE